MKIYVASSWRNARQPEVVEALRAAGFEVYDFRHPAPGDDGFRWSEIDAAWQGWTQAEYVEALNHPIARTGFGLDMDALEGCDACILVMPCGRSAHLELGWAVGAGKYTRILLDTAQPTEPELMYRMANGIDRWIGDTIDALVKERASRAV